MDDLDLNDMDQDDLDLYKRKQVLTEFMALMYRHLKEKNEESTSSEESDSSSSSGETSTSEEEEEKKPAEGVSKPNENIQLSEEECTSSEESELYSSSAKSISEVEKEKKSNKSLKSEENSDGSEFNRGSYVRKVPLSYKPPGLGKDTSPTKLDKSKTCKKPSARRKNAEDGKIQDILEKKKLILKLLRAASRIDRELPPGRRKIEKEEKPIYKKDDTLLSELQISESDKEEIVCKEIKTERPDGLLTNYVDEMFMSPPQKLYKELMVYPTLDRMYRTSIERKKGKIGIQEKLSKEHYDNQLRDEEVVKYVVRVLSDYQSNCIRDVKQLTKLSERTRYETRLRDLEIKMSEEKESAVEEARIAALTEAKNHYEVQINLIQERYSEELKTAIETREAHYKELIRFKLQTLYTDLREDYSDRLRDHAREWVGTVETVKQQHEKHTEENFNILKKHVEAQIQKLLWIQKYLNDLNKAARLKDQVDMAIDFLKVIKQKEVDLLETDKLLDRAKAHIKGWKEVVIDLVQQFQKFINHFLKETPGSAEYMLELGKIIRRQLRYTDLIIRQQSFADSESAEETKASPEKSEANDSSENVLELLGANGPLEEPSKEKLAEEVRKSALTEKQLPSQIDIANWIIEWILARIFETFEKEVVEERPTIEAEESLPDGKQETQDPIKEKECEVPKKRAPIVIDYKGERLMKVLGEYTGESNVEGGFIDERVNSLMGIIAKNPSILKYISPR